MKATKSPRRKGAETPWRTRLGKESEPTLRVLTGGTHLKVRQAVVIRASKPLCVQCTASKRIVLEIATQFDFLLCLIHCDTPLIRFLQFFLQRCHSKQCCQLSFRKIKDASRSARGHDCHRPVVIAHPSCSQNITIATLNRLSKKYMGYIV